MTLKIKTHVSVWRIATDTPAYDAVDMTGKGAELSGGRWNRAGTPLIYAASSAALACLETIVHIGSGALPLNRYLVRIDVPISAWNAAHLATPDLLVGWDALPPGLVSLDWGTSWANSLQTLIARVPSIVVPEEENLLINPRHPEAFRLSVHKLRKWTYDTRLLPTGPGAAT